jgi:broad specificity phosphatase PhoE
MSALLTIFLSTILSWSEPIDWARPQADETILILVRHGEIYGNDPSKETEHTLNGCKTDLPLNANGEAQAEEVAKKFASVQKENNLKIGAIYSSFLTRAIQTAEYFSKELGILSIQRTDLREIYWGEGEGILVTVKNALWGDEEKKIYELILDRKKRWDYLPAIPQAESYNQLLARTLSELEIIAESHRGEVVLIVTHGRLIKTLISDLLDEEISDSIPNCGACVLRSTPTSLQFLEQRSRS